MLYVYEYVHEYVHEYLGNISISVRKYVSGEVEQSMVDHDTDSKQAS